MNDTIEEVCSKCNGDGNIIKEDGPYVCRHCRGTGKVKDWIEQVTGKTNISLAETPILNLGPSSNNPITKKYVDNILDNCMNDKELMLRLKLMLGV